MARKIVRMGCVPMMVRAKSNIMSPPKCVYRPPSPSRSSRAAPCVAELFEYAVHQGRCRRRRLGKPVVEGHRVPFEGAELVEGLYLDPFDVRHRGDEVGNSFDVLGIVRDSGNE